MDLKELTIIIPAYNEEKSLPVFLPGLLEFCKENSCKLNIVNDGSKDNTLSVLKGFSDNTHLNILSHKLNKGYGGAIKSGINAASTKYIVTIDADGQHNLNDIIRLYEEITSKDADMVVGSRKGQKSASLYRSIGKSFIRGLAKFLLPVKIYDINSGMKIYNTELAKKYLKLCPDNMPYSDIITLIFISQKHMVSELPVSINKRIAGSSTISTMTALETIKEILNIVILFNPMKIFFPLSLFCVVAGVAWGIPFMLLGRGLSVGALLAIVVGVVFFLLGLIAEQLSLLRKANIE